MLGLGCRNLRHLPDAVFVGRRRERRTPARPQSSKQTERPGDPSPTLRRAHAAAFSQHLLRSRQTALGRRHAYDTGHLESADRGGSRTSGCRSCQLLAETPEQHGEACGVSRRGRRQASRRTPFGCTETYTQSSGSDACPTCSAHAIDRRDDHAPDEHRAKRRAAFLAASTQGPSRRRPCLRSGSSTTRGCRSCSRTRACRSRAVERGCTDRLGANLLSFCIQQLVRRVGSTDAVENDAAAVTLGRSPAPGDDYCIFRGDADADGAVPQPAARLEATGAALPSSAASAALLDGFGIRCRATA